MTKKYHYQLDGLAGSQNWRVEGDIESEWCDVIDGVMTQAFHKLTKGNAVVGVKCKGPYNITRLILEQRREPDYALAAERCRTEAGSLSVSRYIAECDKEDRR